MEFNFVPLSWKCDKGHVAPNVAVGLTSVGELMVNWYCAECGHKFQVRTPLEELIADIPPHPHIFPFTEDDLKELKAFHISLE